MRERVLGSERVFEGRILTLRVDEVEAADGHRSTREVVEHRGAVGIVCVHDGELVLVRQYRHPVGEVLLEIPAGLIEPDEDPRDCAVRELAEEVRRPVTEISELLRSGEVQDAKTLVGPALLALRS